MKERYSRLKSHAEVSKYISSLKDGTPQRKEQAKQGLIETGVLTHEGKKKDIIVSWE